MKMWAKEFKLNGLIYIQIVRGSRISILYVNMWQEKKKTVNHVWRQWWKGNKTMYREYSYSSVIQSCLTLCMSDSHALVNHTRVWTTAHQASLSIANSQSLPKLISIESVMPSNHFILCCPLLFLHLSFSGSGSFQMSQLFASGGQSIGVSASTSVLPMNIQDWSPLGWTGRISLQSKGLSSVFSNTTVQKHQIFSTQLSSQSNSHIHTWPLEKP